MNTECFLRLTHPVAEKFLKLDNLTPDKHECYSSYQKQKKKSDNLICIFFSVEYVVKFCHSKLVYF